MDASPSSPKPHSLDRLVPTDAALDLFVPDVVGLAVADSVHPQAASSPLPPPYSFGEPPCRLRLPSPPPSVLSYSAAVAARAVRPDHARCTYPRTAVLPIAASAVPPLRAHLQPLSPP